MRALVDLDIALRLHRQRRQHHRRTEAALHLRAHPRGEREWRVPLLDVPVAGLELMELVARLKGRERVLRAVDRQKIVVAPAPCTEGVLMRTGHRNAVKLSAE